MLERFPRSVALTLQSVFDVQQLADSAPSADAANGDLTTAKPADQPVNCSRGNSPAKQITQRGNARSRGRRRSSRKEVRL